MLSLTALLTLCLASALVAAQQPLIFASSSSQSSAATSAPVPSSAAAPPTSAPANNNQQQLVFASSSNNAPPPPPTAGPTSAIAQTIQSIFSTSPTAWNSGASAANGQAQPPRFAAPGLIQIGASGNVGAPGFGTAARSALEEPPQLGPPVFSPSNLPAGRPAMRTDPSQAQENLRRLSKGAEDFCLDFLARISTAHVQVPHRSYMVSPLSVWSLLMLLTEGAEGNTLQELRRTLHLEDQTPQALRVANRQISQRLNAQTDAVEVASFQALFTDINKPVSRDYENAIERDYQSTLTPVNFADINNTFVLINDEIKTATRGLLPYSVLPQDLIDVELLMMSALFFRGKWKFPFDEVNTHKVPFHDEFGEVTGDVDMMTQSGDFTYTQIKELNSHVLELPYGVSNRISMVIIFPKRGVSLNYVMKSLPQVGLAGIVRKLDEEALNALEDGVPQEVEVFLPRFTTQSHFSVRYILETMGLVDVFQPNYANLTKIFKDAYVSSIFQSTRIIVNEEGTEAAAVAIATLINKSSPVKFLLDRPFIYLIMDRAANLLLFAGEVKSHK